MNSPEHQKSNRSNTPHKNKKKKKKIIKGTGEKPEGDEKLNDLMADLGEIAIKKNGKQNAFKNNQLIQNKNNSDGIVNHSAGQMNLRFADYDRDLNNQARLYYQNCLKEENSNNDKDYNKDVTQYLDEEMCAVLKKIRDIKDDNEEYRSIDSETKKQIDEEEKRKLKELEDEKLRLEQLEQERLLKKKLDEEEAIRLQKLNEEMLRKQKLDEEEKIRARKFEEENLRIQELKDEQLRLQKLNEEELRKLNERREEREQERERFAREKKEEEEEKERRRQEEEKEKERKEIERLKQLEDERRERQQIQQIEIELERKKIEQMLRKEQEEADRKRKSELRQLKEQQKLEDIKIEKDHLLSGVNSEGNEDKETSTKDANFSKISEQPEHEELQHEIVTTTSILRKINQKPRMSKRVTFNTKAIDFKTKDINQDFIRKVPTGTITLSEDQREMLINTLEDSSNQDEEEIVLTLKKDQVEDVVITNYIGENATIHIPLEDKREMINREQTSVSIYPKNFFAMVEKQKLKGSRVTVYAGDFMKESEKGLIQKDPSAIRKKRVSIYPKDLFKMTDKEIKEGRISVYPQEFFDMFTKVNEKENKKMNRQKARSIYPKEFLDLADKQAIRNVRGRQKTLYPKELFNMADQEKIDAERVSVYPKDLFKMLSREAQKKRFSVYPKDLFHLLDEEYSNIVKLTPEQTQQMVQKNIADEDTNIIISHKQKEELLTMLKDPDNQKNELVLDKDQVMDILNQNCTVEGTHFDLNSEQIDNLKRKRTLRPTLIGGEYYDALVDQLVNEEGERLLINQLSTSERKSVLSQIGDKTVDVVIAAEENDPEVIPETYYNTIKDDIIETEVIESDNQTRKSKISRISKRMSKIDLKLLPQENQVLNIGEEGYYDAMTDELVDKTGKRYTLKDMNTDQIMEIVDNEECQLVKVVISPELDRDVILENVNYSPIDDCLVDENGRKTQLGDLKENQRESLMKILADKRGSQIKQPKIRKSIHFSRQVNIIEPEPDSEDSDDEREENINKIRNRKKTAFPKKEIEKKKKDTEKLKNDILQGGSKSRGSLKAGKSNYSTKYGRNKAYTINPKDKAPKRVQIMEESEIIMESELEFKPVPKKNIQAKRMTNVSSKTPKITNSRKTLGAKGNDSKKLTREEMKQMADEQKKVKDRAKELRNRNTVVGLKSSNQNKIIKERNSLKASPNQAKQRLKAKTILGKDIYKPTSEENEDVDVDLEDSRKSNLNLRNKNTSKYKINNLHDKYYAGGDNISSKKIMTSQGINLNDGVETDIVEEEEPIIDHQSELNKDETEAKPKKKVKKQTKNIKPNSDEVRHFINENQDQELEEIINASHEDNLQDTINNKPINFNGMNKMVQDSQLQDIPHIRSQQSENELLDLIEQGPNSSNKLNFIKNDDNLEINCLNKESNFNKYLNEFSDERSVPSQSSNDKIYKHEMIVDKNELDKVSDSQLRLKIQKMFKQDQNKFSEDVLKKCEGLMDKHGVNTEREFLLDEFYQFCQHTLPYDEKYKESVLFVSMFYYFLERKKLIKS